MVRVPFVSQAVHQPAKCVLHPYSTLSPLRAGTMGASILWDALVASCIMLQAQIRGFGVYTNCEVFNDILEHHFSDYRNISDEGKLQMVRAVGCVAARSSTLTVRSAFARAAIKSLTHATLCFCRVAIVKNGSMYPTMVFLAPVLCLRFLSLRRVRRALRLIAQFIH